MFRIILVTTLAALVRASYVPSDEGIVGGVNTTIEEHPYHLALFRNKGYGCGASLIKPNIALTAGHCTGRKGNFSVRAGSTDSDNGGLTANVLRICRHPKYKSADYDVSVLLLDRSFPLSASIKTIGLQPVGVEVPEGTIGTVTGWGVLKEGGRAPKALQKVEVPKFNRPRCAKVYKYLTARMSCYGLEEGGKGFCFGDSGGPIVVKGKQTGIVSSGIGCARPAAPGVYTKISNKEIIDHIKECIAKF